MGVKVATACFQWSQTIPHSSCYSQTLASMISSSPSSKQRRNPGRYVRKLNRLSLLQTPLTNFHRRSRYYRNPRIQTMKVSCCANLDDFSDEEFSKQIQELASRFQLSAESIDDDDDDEETVFESNINNEFNTENSCDSQNQLRITLSNIEPPIPWSEINREPPEWTRENEMNPDDIVRKANSVDLPFSLRILKRKLRWKDEINSARVSACCSMKKAFSSMVFMISELHRYSLKLREIPFYEDLQGILNRVEKEMHASFVWLFQQVFSHTPTLMVYIMILLANFTVYSMGNNTAIAAVSSVPQTATDIVQFNSRKVSKFDSSTINQFSISSSGGKTISIGGGNGGGKIRPVANGTDGDGSFDRSSSYGTVMPDGVSQFSSVGTSGEKTESMTEENTTGEDLSLWDSTEEEQEEVINEDIRRDLVSPVMVNLEVDDFREFFRTEFLYQMIISQEPNNPLLLANYAQFLYLVARDFDRAEHYFKRAVGVKPADAEAWNKYATFLWKVRKDLWAAEETFLEAINVEPENSFYSANYAHFLWNNGAEDICFPT